MDDAKVTAVLHHAVRGIEAPTERLIDVSIGRGRRRRRARRAVEAASVLSVAAALVALVAVVLPDSPARYRPAAGPSAPLSASPTTSATLPPTSPSTAPSTAPPTAPTVVITPQALLQTTLHLLPRPGTTSSYEGNASLGNASTVFVYDDGQGAAQVGVSLDYPLPDGPLASPCNEITTCTHRPDGSTVAVYQGNAHPGRPELPGKDWEITVLRPDGIAVTVSEWNSSDGKNATITRDDPPFTIGEATAIAAAPDYAERISRQRADAAARLFVSDPDPDPDPDPDTAAPTTAPTSH